MFSLLMVVLSRLPLVSVEGTRTSQKAGAAHYDSNPHSLPHATGNGSSLRCI